ncbi:hypothetical protein IIA16_04555, partial [bacterium]|nr:hypothetical protein [bacterium]
GAMLAGSLVDGKVAIWGRRPDAPAESVTEAVPDEAVPMVVAKPKAAKGRAPIRKDISLAFLANPRTRLLIIGALLLVVAIMATGLYQRGSTLPTEETRAAKAALRDGDWAAATEPLTTLFNCCQKFPQVGQLLDEYKENAWADSRAEIEAAIERGDWGAAWGGVGVIPAQKPPPPGWLPELRLRVAKGWL